jgi:hypothetical protein
MTGSREPEDPPPVLGRWRNIYLVVLLELGALIVLFHLLTRWAS